MERHGGNDRGTCWSCGRPAGPDPLCAACGVVQPAGTLDHFARLGLARRFDLDPFALERAYIGLQTRLHPDRFVARSDRERRFSADQSVAVNEAYATLKGARSRARYLVALAGRAVAGEDGATIDDPAVLIEALETREALADAADAVAVAAVARRNAESVAACHDALTAAFAAADLDQATRLVLRLAYLEKLGLEAKRRRLALLGAAA